MDSSMAGGVTGEAGHGMEVEGETLAEGEGDPSHTPREMSNKAAEAVLWAGEWDSCRAGGRAQPST